MLNEEETHQQVVDFLNNTAEAREVSEVCRDYYDHEQWTSEEIRELAARYQAPVVVNRIKPKVNGLVGLYDLRSSDPKAYPRTQAHEEASHAVTDALRFVADNNDFDDIRLAVAEDFFVEGYGGAMIDVRQRANKEIIIRIEQIPWDRIYFDPHSRKKDFSDSRYMGIIIWMGLDEWKEKFPGRNPDQFFHDSIQATDETFEDRPRWMDTSANRIRMALHFHVHKSKWHMSGISGPRFVIKPQLSPFLDDEGEPSNPIELVSANVKRRNNERYGEVKGFLDAQREINHRRSKFLHGNSSRQTFGRKGVNKDVRGIKREMSKPDGHVEFIGEEFGKDFGVIPTQDMSRAQFELYQDAKAEMDAISFNAQLAGERQNGDLSGRAIDKLQQAGTIELNQQYRLLSKWEKRIYKQVWSRVKQFWTSEKWIRVTDDQDNLRWVGFNVPITLQQRLEETINDESRNVVERREAAQLFTEMLQAQDPRLGELVETRNPTPELETDIKLDQSFDVINIQEEQFQMLLEFAKGSNDIDIVQLIELSQLRGKEDLIDKIEKRREEAAKASGNVAQLEAQSMENQNLKTQMEAADKEQSAIQKKIENTLLITDPDRVTSVAV